MRERRADVLAKPDTLRDIVVDGSREARLVAQETMARVREAMKISYVPLMASRPACSITPTSSRRPTPTPSSWTTSRARSIC